MDTLLDLPVSAHDRLSQDRDENMKVLCDILFHVHQGGLQELGSLDFRDLPLFEVPDDVMHHWNEAGLHEGPIPQRWPLREGSRQSERSFFNRMKYAREHPPVSLRLPWYVTQLVLELFLVVSYMLLPEGPQPL